MKTCISHMYKIIFKMTPLTRWLSNPKFSSKNMIKEFFFELLCKSRIVNKLY